MTRNTRLIVLFLVSATVFLSGCFVINYGESETQTQAPEATVTPEVTFTDAFTSTLTSTSSQEKSVTADLTITPQVTSTQSAEGTDVITTTPEETTTVDAASVEDITTTPVVTGTPTATATQAEGGLFSNVSISIEPPDLSAKEVVELIISSLIIIFAVIYGGKLVHLLLRQLTKRSRNTFDDAILDAIKPQIRLFIAALGFQVATFRLPFIGNSLEAMLETVYFVLYLYVFSATIWRSIDFSMQWYLDNQDPDADKTLSKTMVLFLSRVSHILLLILGLAALLAHFGVSLLAITAAMGMSGFALSLALKDTISNIISGIVLMIDQPFKIGDRIDVPVLDVWGDVVSIGIRSTSVVTRDNRLVVVPNSSVVDNSVTNYSRPDPTYRLQSDIGIGTGEDIPKVVKILRDTVQIVDGVLKDKPVDILFTGFGDSSNTFRVRWWVSSYADKRRVSHSVNTAIQEAANKEGIDMPNPIYTLDNQINISDEDIDNIAKSFKEPDESQG
jgi:MscS family membrane protein